MLSSTVFAEISVFNGSFEQVEGEKLLPLGWQMPQGGWKIVEDGQGRFCLSLEQAQERAIFATQEIPLASNPSRSLTFSWLVKGEDIEIGQDRNDLGKISLTFHDSRGKVIKLQTLDTFRGSFAWRPGTQSARVPSGVTAVKVAIGLDNCKGKIYFDEISVIDGFPEDLDLENRIIDGGFEYNYLISPWEGAGRARIIFPGFSGKGSLNIPGSSSVIQDIPVSNIDVSRVKELRISLDSRYIPDFPSQKISRSLGRINLRFLDLQNKLIKEEDWGLEGLSQDWKHLERSFSLPPTSSLISVEIVMSGEGVSLNLDNLRLELFDEEGEKIERASGSKTDTKDWLAVDLAKISPPDMSFLLDKPAGKHGFLEVKDGHFYFADGTRARFFGVNIMGESAFPEHARAEVVAKELAQMGANIVRLHYLDSDWMKSVFDPGYNDTQHFSAANMDRLDYFIYQLKKQGIYVYFDLLVRRRFKEGDKVKESKHLEGGAKLVAQFDLRIIELQKQYAQMLLTHYNPYTKTRYVDEPAIALISLINESSLFLWEEKKDDIPPFYFKELKEKISLEDYKGEKIRKQKDKAGEEKTKNRKKKLGGNNKISAALFQLQVSYFQEMAGYLRKIGLKIPVAGSNMHLGGLDLASNAQLDFIDRHAYWDHPTGGFGDLVKCKNISMLRNPARSTLVKLAQWKVKGKPYVVSEWNNPWPNEFRAEGVIPLAAFACLQDWDALIQFNYSGRRENNPIENNFDIADKPEMFMQFPFAALLFHRQDVAGAREIKEFPLTYAERLLAPQEVFSHRTERTLEFRNLAFLNLSNEGEFQSDTGDCFWNAKDGFFSIDSARFQSAVGFLADQEIKLKNLELGVDSEFAAVSLASLDGKEIAASGVLFLSAASKSENSGTIYNLRRTFLKDAGTGPVLVSPIKAKIKIRFPSSVDSVSISAFTYDGKRKEKHDFSLDKDILSFELSPQDSAWGYEILLKRGK